MILQREPCTFFKHWSIISLVLDPKQNVLALGFKQQVLKANMDFSAKSVNLVLYSGTLMKI